MFFIDLIFAVLMAALVALLLVGAWGWRHPRHPGAGPAALFLFLILWAVIWAFAVWSAPVGPVAWGGYWLPYLVIGLMLGLLFLAVAQMAGPADKTRSEHAPTTGTGEPLESTPGIAAVFGVFFWLLIVAALIIIFFAYQT